MTALTLLGVPYRFGGDDPARGLDCSGLVRHVFRVSAGLDLPRRSEEIARAGADVPRTGLQAGDLVFFDTLDRPYSHVGIYLGDGRFVHAPARRGVVRIEPMDAGYWERRYNGARRLSAAQGSMPSGSLPSASPSAPPPPPQPAATVPAR